MIGALVDCSSFLCAIRKDQHWTARHAYDLCSRTAGNGIAEICPTMGRNYDQIGILIGSVANSALESLVHVRFAKLIGLAPLGEPVSNRFTISARHRTVPAGW
jgi:hypothetical protein